ncbi:MAG: porphobilinogen synthase [Longimicrobiales bacterium]|nr:porphobilinogen synthase [Longimicrobiales bacterium]
MSDPVRRPQRMRQSGRWRRLVRETILRPGDLVLPLFVKAGSGDPTSVQSMPGVEQRSPEHVVELAQRADEMGLAGVILFGIPASKDETGSSAWDPDGPVPRAIRAIKSAVPGLLVWADVCLCEYTSHGHCGVLDGDRIDGDRTLPLLARAALTYASAGADAVAPSDMFDGRVGHIRAALDDEGFPMTPIVSYAVKYASALYGPFRDAAGSSLVQGDRRSHQMDPANSREALREAQLDMEEEADILMVKPASYYLDVIERVRAMTDRPVAAYQVSGEFSMIKAAAANGWLDERAVVLESLLSIRRAGADCILTYFALDAAQWLRRG